MFAPNNPSDAIAVGRLLEFLSERTPWHRSLWGVGVVLAMEELHEACTFMRHGHLSESSVRRMISSLQKRVGKHPAFSTDEKQFFQNQVQTLPRADGVAHFGIKELSHRVSNGYLKRWATVVASGNIPVELFARSVAAYLLDSGFSERYLYGLIKVQLNKPEPITLPELCELLHAEISRSPRREFEALLAFTAPPHGLDGIPDSWLKGAAVISWLEQNGFETAGVRSPLAMVLKVHARDSVGAAQAARNESDRYAARALLATGRPLIRSATIWVKGETKPEAIREVSRGVRVKELLREGRVFSADASQSVDAALELLAHLEESSPPAAIAGGWGAIEGLLADPSDRASAADNLATLVTCSFPRAELTSLAHRFMQLFPDQSADLAAQETNRERSRAMAQMIVDARMPRMPGVGDQAAVDRMSKLLLDPRNELQTIKDLISESFHRLYRQRNLILHGGRLDSVALSASLRTVSKLAGAGMDRITYGHYVQQVKPMELVAKANLALAVASPSSPTGCVDLLEAINS